MRQPYETVLGELQLLHKLQEFQPVVIGTLPLGIDVTTSDIDVACFATDLEYFLDYTKTSFGNLDRFSCEYIEVRAQTAACTAFWFQGWEIELFCQTIRVEDQWDVRHFTAERRLLEIEPRLREVVFRLKQDGLKTEPAFAHALKLIGDPYEAILDLESKSDGDLADIAVRSIIQV